MGGLTSPDLVLTGVPRGGTTLACQLLQQCHDTVALFEPMDVASLPFDRDAAVGEISRYFHDCRQQLLRDGSAPSKQVAGAVPDNPFSSAMGADGQRRMLASPGRVQAEHPLSPDFTLAIKHNAAFAALLPELSARFRTLAIVRNPLSVLASWNSVKLPVSDGRIPAGERFDPDLASRLDHEPDRLARQLLVLEWFFSQFDRSLPAAQVIRYEDVIATQGAQLRTRAQCQGPATIPLSERNASALYPRALVPRLVEALRAQAGSWQRWYPLSAIDGLATRLLATPALP